MNDEDSDEESSEDETSLNLLAMQMQKFQHKKVSLAQLWEIWCV